MNERISMKNKIRFILFIVSLAGMSAGCHKMNIEGKSMTVLTQDLIVETLEEKYPEKTFTVKEQNGLYYHVVDNNGIAFQVEPIKDTRLQFWCRDNYPDAYFEANGTLDECNEVLERYGMENKIELGKPLVLNLGIIDDEENRMQMGECFDELGELLKIPFEVTYYDKGTPQQGEEYRGSSTVGTFSYISLDYTFKEPHIRTFADEGTILIEDMQEATGGVELLESMIAQVNTYDAIGEALEPEFYRQIIEAVEEGYRPVEVYGDDYRHFDISIEMIHTKITGNIKAPVLTIENKGKDEDGNVILHVIAENGDEVIMHLGMNEDVRYSYKLEKLF